MNDSRVAYLRMLQRIRYEEPETHPPSPLDFTPHTHIMGKDYNRDHPYYRKMYDYHMKNYGPFLETLSEPERQMLEFRRPVKIGHMGAYLRGEYPNMPDWQTKRFQDGIHIMDGIIKRAPPTKQDLYLYRGMREIEPDSVPPGTQLYEPGFPSMSLNGFISAGAFSRQGRAFRIRVPQGTHLAPVTASQIRDRGYDRDDHKIHEMEHELLPGRGHTLKITSPLWHDPATTMHFIDAELMPQGPHDPSRHRQPWGTYK